MLDLARAVENIEALAWAELQLALSPQVRARLGVEILHSSGATLLLAPHADVLQLNRVIGLGMAEALTPADLDWIISTYSAARVSKFLVHWGPVCEPTHGPEWLRARQFRQIAGTTKLVRRLDLRDRLGASVSNLRVVEIDERDASTFETIVGTALGVPHLVAEGIRSTIGHPGWHFYLAMDGKRPVAGGALYLRKMSAWCGLAGTLAADRGRGAQTNLLLRRIADASRAGCTFLSADTAATRDGTNQSLKNMIRAGFEILYERDNYLLDLDVVRGR
jgi:hypothetical protein